MEKRDIHLSYGWIPGQSRTGSANQNPNKTLVYRSMISPFRDFVGEVGRLGAYCKGVHSERVLCLTYFIVVGVFGGVD